VLTRGLKAAAMAGAQEDRRKSRRKSDAPEHGKKSVAKGLSELH